MLQHGEQIIVHEHVPIYCTTVADTDSVVILRRMWGLLCKGTRNTASSGPCDCICRPQAARDPTVRLSKQSAILQNDLKPTSSSPDSKDPTLPSVAHHDQERTSESTGHCGSSYEQR